MSSLFGGFSGGIAATIASSFVIYNFFIEPAFTFRFENPSDVIPILIFLVMGTSISVILDQWRQRKLELARLGTIVESADEAIISKDLNGVVRSWNRGAHKLFGYSADEMIGRSVNVLIPPEKQRQEEEILQRLKAGEPVENLETVQLTKDYRRVDVSETTSPVLDERGRIVGASMIVQDITERKRTVAALTAAKEAAENTVRMKSRFLDTSAHELRSPVTALSLFLQVTQMEFQKGRPVAKDTLDRLRKEVDRLS